MRPDSNHEVGKLINYFETVINDLNKDCTPTATKSSPQQDIRTTSQNTSNLTLSFVETPQPVSSVLPTIADAKEEEEEDIYDRLTYQTLVHTNSYSSHGHVIQASIKSAKRRRHFNHHTTKKRLHRRRAPTYIKELKAYLAHRESSFTEVVKISDVKKFSNVLVWLSNQTTSASLIETSTPTAISLMKTDLTTDTNNHSLSITTDSVIAVTQEISQSYSDPISPFTDRADTSELSTKPSLTYLTYGNVPWKLKIRKEVFTPNETFDHPILIELLYLQIVRDIYSPVCLRISEAERTNMKTFLSSHGVATLADINLVKTSFAKKTIIEQARQWPLYFSRLFPLSASKSQTKEEQLLGISHSGLRFIAQSQTTTNRSSLRILETITFDAIQHISSIRNSSTIDLQLARKCITIQSSRIGKLQSMLEKFFKESRKLARTNAVKSSPVPLTDSVDLLKSSSQTSFISCSQTFSELIPSLSVEVRAPLPTGHSMMEFALQNFTIPTKRRSKKSWKTSEWTWKDYAELIRWSKHPVQTALLRHSSNDSIRISRQCFLAIMRFMGDSPMIRGQTDIDCLLYLLKHMHKHRTLIDEIFCQIIKQLTDNRSIKPSSIARGWKLLAIVLNYFIPSEHFQGYFRKYLQENETEVLVQLCKKHYEQTAKYGGRKNAPSKTEIDLLTTSGRNGGKRQTFLLPGGYPLTILGTPSMVIGDCLNRLCELIHVFDTVENEEYSIFMISTSEHSSRLLNPGEYLFDILSECVRSNINNFHLIMKRMLWFNIPFVSEQRNNSEMFIKFMYYQLVPEFLEGVMIVLESSHLSDQWMLEISLMAALQYRAANKIGRPSMKEVKHLLPASVLKLKNIRPQQWTAAIHDQLYASVQSMSIIEAKIKFLGLIQTWSLFGITFFMVETIDEPSIRSPCLMGISKDGLKLLDLDTRKTMLTILYNDVVSIRRRQTTIDIKYGSLTQPNSLQCQVERARDLLALSGRYLSFIGRSISSMIVSKSDGQAKLD